MAQRKAKRLSLALTFVIHTLSPIHKNPEQQNISTMTSKRTSKAQHRKSGTVAEAAPSSHPASNASPAAVCVGHQAEEPLASSHKTANTSKQVPTDRPVRVYADGIFDCFHYGHARALEQAKKAFPNTILVVGVCNDAVTHAYKGRTVMTEEERYESVRHCKWVDEVIRDAPWVIDIPFLDKHNIDYVAHDDLPYADASGQCDDVYGIVKKAGRFRATQRTEGISTSDLILRVLRDYNDYVLRNLQRGYTRKQLGISLVKEQRIRASARLKKLREQLAQHADVARQLRVAGGQISKHMGLAPKKHGSAAARRRTTMSSLFAGAGGSKVVARRNVRGGLNLAEVLELKGRELAAGVEQIVEKMVPEQVRAELLMVGGHMDTFLSGCMRVLEDSYSRLENLALRPLRPWQPMVQ